VARGVSIHAFRGEGDVEQLRRLLHSDVSIHAFCGEGDSSGLRNRISCCMFQSTPSGGKATGESASFSVPGAIVSIHAFRGEGDAVQGDKVDKCRGFNPRLPGGRRR